MPSEICKHCDSVVVLRLGHWVHDRGHGYFESRCGDRGTHARPHTSASLRAKRLPNDLDELVDNLLFVQLGLPERAETTRHELQRVIMQVRELAAVSRA